MVRWARLLLAGAILGGAGLWVPSFTSVSAATLKAAGGSHRSYPGYIVYWDQNEEQDFFNSMTGQIGQLVAPYNPNGQMCIFPDGSGRFVTGYNPTTADQNNPGSLRPVMQPPVGEAVWDRHGNFTGQTIYVPGSYNFPGQTVGGDIPPDSGGNFNNDGTFTGCAFNQQGDLFAVDLGTAQGQFPSPDNGRLIEWFAPNYQSYCIVAGPTSGGVGPHHVDGTGGLGQPGDMAFDSRGNLLVPEVGAPSAPFSGKVVLFDHGSLPGTPAECGPDGIYPASKLTTSVFVQGRHGKLPFPQSIAWDPRCSCWGVSSTIGDPAIGLFNKKGHRLSSKSSVPGVSFFAVGQDPNGYNPFGLAFAPDGTAYFADIHIQCSAPLTNCGPGNNTGRIMRVTYTHGRASPPTAIATGYDFPTSVTICVPSRELCPLPAP